MRFPGLTGVALVVLALGCGNQTPARTAEEGLKRIPAAPADIRFVDAALEERYLAYDKEIAALKSHGWKITPPELVEEWRNGPTYLERTGEDTTVPAVARVPIGKRGPARSFRFIVRRDADRGSFNEIQCHVFDVSGEQIAFMASRSTFLRNGSVVDLLGLRYEASPFSSPRLSQRYSVPETLAVAQMTDDGDYALKVNAVPWGDSSESAFAEEQLAAAFCDALKSAEAFRDFELELCDRLEADLRRRVAAEEFALVDYKHRGRGAPLEVPYRPDTTEFRLTEELKEQLLQKGLTELEHRRTRWKAHSDQLYTELKASVVSLPNSTRTP